MSVEVLGYEGVKPGFGGESGEYKVDMMKFRKLALEESGSEQSSAEYGNAGRRVGARMHTP